MLKCARLPQDFECVQWSRSFERVSMTHWLRIYHFGYCVTIWGCCVLSAEGARHCGLTQSQVVFLWFEMFWRDLSCKKKYEKIVFSASGCLFVCLFSAGIGPGFIVRKSLVKKVLALLHFGGCKSM